MKYFRWGVSSIFIIMALFGLANVLYTGAHPGYLVISLIYLLCGLGVAGFGGILVRYLAIAVSALLCLSFSGFIYFLMNPEDGELYRLLLAVSFWFGVLGVLSLYCLLSGRGREASAV